MKFYCNPVRVNVDPQVSRPDDFPSFTGYHHASLPYVIGGSISPFFDADSLSDAWSLALAGTAAGFLLLPWFYRRFNKQPRATSFQILS